MSCLNLFHEALGTHSCILSFYYVCTIGDNGLDKCVYCICSDFSSERGPRKKPSFGAGLAVNPALNGVTCTL